MSNVQNFLPYSNDLTNGAGPYGGALVGITMADGGIVNPLGGANNATKLTEVAVINAHTLSLAISAYLTTAYQCARRVYTLSVFLKNGTRQYAGLRASVLVGSEATFDLVNGVPTNVSNCLSYGMEAVTGQAGWYRCWITFPLDSVGAPAAQIFLSDTGGAYAAYPGDITKYIYAWGFQWVAANWPGDFVVTGATATGQTTPPTNMNIYQSSFIPTCLQFTSDGVEYMTFPNAAVTFGTGSMVLAFWYKRNGEVISSTHNIVSTDGNNYAAGLYLNQAGPDLGIYVQSAGPSTTTIGLFNPTAASGMDAGWHRIVITVSAADLKVRTYKDGVLFATSPAIAAWNITSANAGYVGWNPNIAQHSRMRFGDLVIQKGGTVPTDADVWADFARGVQLPGATTRYKLNDYNSTSAVDSIGGLTGTISAASLWTTDAPSRVARPLPSQNLAIYSEDFSQAYYLPSQGSISTNVIANPVSGVVTADAFLDTVVNSQHYIQVNTTGTAGATTAGATYTMSVFVKAAAKTVFYMQGGASLMYYDLSTGATAVISPAPLSYGIEAVGNSGWYRCWLSYVATGGNNQWMQPAAAFGTLAYAGTGAAAVYLWGFSLTQGYVPVDYVPTSGTPVNSGSVPRAA